jgi:hypothetical protein
LDHFLGLRGRLLDDKPIRRPHIEIGYRHSESSITGNLDWGAAYHASTNRTEDVRVETILDTASGLYRVEVYYPDNATVPFVSTAPTFRSFDEAEQHAIDTFKRTFPDKPVTSKL